MWENIEIWMEEHAVLLSWGVGISILTFVGSLVVVPYVIIRMRADYFSRQELGCIPRSLGQLLRRIAKSLVGAVLLLTGIAMLFLPGQGLLTILLGISLLDFPRKRSLQLRLLRLKGIHRSVDWIRKKAHREPLELPDR